MTRDPDIVVARVSTKVSSPQPGTLCSTIFGDSLSRHLTCNPPVFVCNGISRLRRGKGYVWCTLAVSSAASSPPGGNTAISRLVDKLKTFLKDFYVEEGDDDDKRKVFKYSDQLVRQGKPRFEEKLARNALYQPLLANRQKSAITVDLDDVAEVRKKKMKRSRIALKSRASRTIKISPIESRSIRNAT